MHIRYIAIIAAGLFATSTLAGCATTPPSTSDRKDPEVETSEETPSASPDGSEKKPGNVHANYSVAHMILPAIFYRRPERMIVNMHRGDGASMVADLWNSTAKKEDISVRVSPGDFATERTQHAINDQTVYILVLTFPEPHQTTHPFMTAMVVQPDGGSLQPTEGDGPRRGTKAWYFTLEKSAAEMLAKAKGKEKTEDLRMTTFGAWTGRPAHLNFGDGPEDDPEAFRRRILDYLADNAPDSWHEGKQ
jgi:hypothetical protein